MKTRIITDSTADIPKVLVEKYGIIVLPLTVHFGSEEYRDGVDITQEEFYKKLAVSTSLPTTSQVAPSSFISIYKDELEKGNNIISIHISSELSGTYQSAVIAREYLKDDRVFVIDSRSATIACGMSVIKAAELAEEGMECEKIVKEIEEYKKKIRLLIAVDTLKYLKMGGRLSGTQAFIGDMLNIKPLLTVEDGKVIMMDKLRGTKKVLNRIVDIISINGENRPGQVMGLGNAMNPAAKEEIKDMITSLLGDVDFIETEVGSVIATHVGPGAFGVVFVEK